MRLGDGKWCAAVSVGGGRRRVMYAWTRYEVARWLDEILHVERSASTPRLEEPTVASYLQQWVADSAARVRRSTWRSYESLVRVHLDPDLGVLHLVGSRPWDVQDFLNRKLASGLSPRTCRFLLAILRASLARAVKWELVNRNVALLVDAPRVPETPVVPLSSQTVAGLVVAARGSRLENLFVFLLATGLRIGEALALRWTEVDIAARTISVKWTLQRPRGESWCLTEPKSRSSRRIVPMIQPCLGALQAQQQVILELRARCGGRWSDGGFVFPSSMGGPLDASNVLHEFKRPLKVAGVPTTHRVHDLRHSCATYLLAAGVPLRSAMEILGHSQVATTIRYQHVSEAMLHDAAARLERVFPIEPRVI